MGRDARAAVPRAGEALGLKGPGAGALFSGPVARSNLLPVWRALAGLWLSGWGLGGFGHAGGQQSRDGILWLEGRLSGLCLRA
jgi:hypothetical protein